MTKDNQAKQAYIKELIESLESLKSLMMLYVTFDIGLIALTISGFIFTEFRDTINESEKTILSWSLIFVVISAGFYIIWAGIIQGLRSRAIDWMITLDVDEARRIHYPGRIAYKKWGWTSIVAIVLMMLGIAGYLTFILMLLS